MEPHTPSNPNRPHRRDFLKAGAAAGLTLAVGESADSRPPLARAKSCIFLMLTGGPSHLDTWDPKPAAPSDIRGPFRPISTSVPGMFVSELFPKMAAMADKFALVRSLHHTAAPIHENGFQLLNTGRLFRDGPEWPNLATVVTYLRTLGRWPAPTEFTLETMVELSRQSGSVISRTGAVETGVHVSHGQGCGFLTSPIHYGPGIWYGWQQRVLPNDVERYQDLLSFGWTEFGQNCRMACDWVEQGGRSVLTVNMYGTVFDAVSWDCHADGGSLATDLGDYRDTVAPTFDTAFTTLVTRLEERGMLDETLVVAVGEFGRTPKLNANGGRDHWPGCWTAILAGGGVQGGRVVGSSDATGAEPKDRPVTCPELVATIYHALGIPADTRIPGPDGSPVPVVEASPVLELF